jgi:threonine synthase
MQTKQIQQNKLAKKIGLENGLYFKREDLHKYGSHKGRSIPFLIDKYCRAGWRNFVVSSSGNAAIVALMHITEYNLKHKTKPISLLIIIGKNIEKNKLKILKTQAKNNPAIEIQTSPNPKQTAFMVEKNNLAKNLRQSTDETAVIAYVELAKELSKIKNLSAVFVPTSSGTTAYGLYLGFKKLKIKPQIHIAQTPACHPFVSSSKKSTASLAKAIVDKVGHRKKQILELLKYTKGNGWIIDNQEIINAIKITKQTEKINISPNSALSVAALIKAKKQGLIWNGPAVCIITGQ